MTAKRKETWPKAGTFRLPAEYFRGLDSLYGDADAYVRRFEQNAKLVPTIPPRQQDAR